MSGLTVLVSRETGRLGQKADVSASTASLDVHRWIGANALAHRDVESSISRYRSWALKHFLGIAKGGGTSP